MFTNFCHVCILDTTTSTTFSKRIFPSANTRESVIIWTTDRFIFYKKKITSESFIRDYSIQISSTTKKILHETPKTPRGDFVLSTRIIPTATNQNISILRSSPTLVFPSTNKNQTVNVDVPIQGKLLL